MNQATFEDILRSNLNLTKARNAVIFRPSQTLKKRIDLKLLTLETHL